MRYQLKSFIMDDQMLGLRIRQKREELNLSQTELAELIGVDQGMMSRIELGKRKIDSTKELPLLAKALGCPYSWFLEEGGVIKDEITLESLIRHKFPKIDLTDEEVNRLSEITKTFLEGVIKADPQLSKRVS